MIKMPDNNKYSAALYMRLSRDDENAAESASIKTQRSMLKKFAKENSFYVYDEYIDDGFSGTNFERPSFKRMLRDIENKKINMVITKDLSRLGRDYITTGEYTEIYFPAKKVRYIAINDGYDSETPYTDIVPFKNVINEMYARDISKKIRSAFVVKMQEGAFIGCKAPYGYKRDPGDKHHLVIDETVSYIVKEIFRLAADGVLPVNIARILNERRILTPTLYRYTNTPYMNKDDITVNRKWTSATITKMLRNIVYLGHMAQGKTTKVSFKSNIVISNPKENWYISQNTHEALIDKETFNLASKKSKQRTCKAKGSFKNIFSGIAVCADCGRSMSSVGTRKKDSVANLACGAYKQYGKTKCTNHFIDYDILYSLVLNSIRDQFSVILTNESREKIIKEAAYRLHTTPRLSKEKTIANLKKRKSELDILIETLYEDHAKNLINTERMHKMLRKYESESNIIDVKLNEKDFSQKITTGNSSAGVESELQKILQSYIDIKELTPDILLRLIDRIEICQGTYSKTKDGQTKSQTIKIFYRFAEHI